MTPLPANEHALCNFSAWLVISNVKHSTVKVYLLAVRQLHIENGARGVKDVAAVTGAAGGSERYNPSPRSQHRGRGSR